LSLGARLGVYEILSLIGSGGMGEVYRAKDTKLGRDVALKILPATFTNDPERVARFRREAQVLASLNHPHIAQIYGMEESNSTQFLVLELVDGESLDKRIPRGPMPVDEALAIAKQIAEALEAAHEKGIIHRDLKPANVALTKDGSVKVLDFGLAKAVENASRSLDARNSPTITSPAMATGVGVILGTAAYMSPEQARGRTADKRSDIWAFGCVVFETLTGRRAFEGDDVSVTLASVLKSEPDWTWLSVRSQQALALKRLLARCLTKDAKNRLQSMGDARIEIAEMLSAATEESPMPSTASTDSPLGRRAIPWAVTVAAFTLASIAGVGWWRVALSVERPLLRLDVDLGANVTLAALSSGSTVIISPDGTRLVYIASSGPGSARLFSRRLDQAQAAELTGTEGATWPFFSPDGQTVGFAARNVLNKISADGGLVVALAEVVAFTGGSWSQDGNILVGARGLMRIPDGGGTPTTVTELASGELVHARPQVLPGGKAVLFTVRRSTGDASTASIDVVSLADHRRKTLLRGAAAGRFLSSGHLVYGDRGTLYAIPFDLDRLETHGRAVPVLDGVAYVAQSGNTDFDVSDGGTLVYRKGGGREAAIPQATLIWLDATGRKTTLRDKSGDYEWPSFSPVGQRLALSATINGTRDVWIYDWQRDTMTRLTIGANSGAPTWSPDGRYLVFSRGFAGGLSWIGADGSGQLQSLTQSRNFQVSPSFTPDGKRLVFVEPKGPNSQIWTVPVDERGGALRAGSPELILTVPLVAPFSVVSISSDGRWLAYPSTETGAAEVYVRPFQSAPSVPGSKWQISNAGGVFPIWSRTSHELFYQSGEQIMTVEYEVNGDSFVPEKPRVWATRVAGLVADGTRRFDVAPDGKRLVVLVPVEPERAIKVDHDVGFVLNFLDELSRRVPVKP
jgi:serine/threonine-protein kinase